MVNEKIGILNRTIIIVVVILLIVLLILVPLIPIQKCEGIIQGIKYNCNVDTMSIVEWLTGE